MITGQQLKSICGSLDIDQATRIAYLLDSICPKYGINSPDIFHEFIANVLHESKEFTAMEENLNYSATALRSLFGRHRISDSDCEKYGRTAIHWQ